MFCSIPRPAGSRQGNHGVATQSQLLFLVVDPVLEKPALGPVRTDLQIKPGRITETRLLALWGAYGVTALKVSQHGGTKRWIKVSGGGTDSPMANPRLHREVGVQNTDFTRFLWLYPHLYPHFSLAGHGRPWTAMDVKSLIYQRKRASTGLVWTPLDGCRVELAGIEPASASLHRADLHV